MSRGRPPICPSCKSNRSQKKGVRKTKTMGARRIRLCKNCGKKFTPKNQKLIQIEDVQGKVTTADEPENPSVVSAEQLEMTEMKRLES